MEKGMGNPDIFFKGGGGKNILLQVFALPRFFCLFNRFKKDNNFGNKSHFHPFFAIQQSTPGEGHLFPQSPPENAPVGQYDFPLTPVGETMPGQ